jgi:predicted  nucleic acid-binding Zn-ribbon protein
MERQTEELNTKLHTAETSLTDARSTNDKLLTDISDLTSREESLNNELDSLRLNIDEKSSQLLLLEKRINVDRHDAGVMFSPLLASVHDVSAQTMYVEIKKEAPTLPLITVKLVQSQSPNDTTATSQHIQRVIIHKRQ